MGNLCGRKGPSKKALADRARKVEVLSLLHFLDGHRITCDNHLRQNENKDSGFELEKLRAEVMENYQKQVLQPIEEQFKHRKHHHGEAKEAKIAYEKMMHSVTVTPIELEYLQSSLLVMETYKRLTTGMERDLAALRKQRVLANERFNEHITELREQVTLAERAHWCRKQIKRWEPERDPSFQRKLLAIEGGPPSPPLPGPGSPLVSAQTDF